jgi:hypothetical protein
MSDEVFASLAGAAAGAVQGWLGALILAGPAQDRERLIWYLSISGPLLTDLRRIQLELGTLESPSLQLTIYGASAAPPTFDELIRSVIPEIVSADPDILRLFLTVDSSLINYATFDSIAGEHSETVPGLAACVRISQAQTKGGDVPAFPISDAPEVRELPVAH